MIQRSMGKATFNNHEKRQVMAGKDEVTTDYVPEIEG
jgi:hypothetical protein